MLLCGISILVGVLLALIYCRSKEIQLWYVHALLQFFGLVGVVAIGGNFLISGPAFVLAVALIACYKRKNLQGLSASPVYILLYYLPFLAAASIGLLFNIDSLPALPVMFLETGQSVILFWTFIVAVLSLLWCNTQLKKQFSWVYWLAILSVILSVIVFKYIFFFTFWYLETGGTA